MRLKEELRNELAAMVQDEGLELLEVEVVGSGPKTVLRLIVDGPAGVTLDQCARVSRQASAYLDVEDPFSHTYTLEVSSPGIERKLYSQADYRRFAGHRVKVRMKPEYRVHRVVSGELLGIEDGVVRVMTPEGETVELPLESVFESRLQVDWKALMRERKCRL
jgi:ribosome maturation factor RimP